MKWFRGKAVKEKAVFFEKPVLESIVSFARGVHPEEGILLLSGKSDKEKIVIKNTLIPPFATHGRGFSSFPMFSLPADPSILGVAHSHPSGHLWPSTQDLNMIYGKIMVLVAYPYTLEDVAVFDKSGKPVKFSIA